MPNYKSFLVTETEGNMSDDARDFNNIDTRVVIKLEQRPKKCIELRGNYLE